MDYDTTRTKDSYEQILSAFSRQEADILIGTQMIVKGHDFPNVTDIRRTAGRALTYHRRFIAAVMADQPAVFMLA